MNNRTVTRSAVASGPLITKTGSFLPVLLFFLSLYPQLSTDMYLPALPLMIKVFDTSGSTINLTVIFFFIFFAIATLFWGPLSDQFGRRPTLLIGIALYSLASIGCVFSESVNQLIFARILQAIGAGAPMTISFSIVQDRYTGEAKKKLLSILSALTMTAPAVAPIMGSTILVVFDWRMIFVLLFLLGVGSFIGCLFLTESCPAKITRNSTESNFFKGIPRVLSRTFFRQSLLVFSLPAICALGFVGASPLIFMKEFGLDSRTFSYLFAANAVVSILGSLLYIPISKILSNKTITAAAFLILALSGVLVTLFGGSDPYLFLLCLLPGSLMVAMTRPLSVHLMMDSAGPDSGAASAIINFLFTIFGSLGIYLISMEWDSMASVYGIIAIVAGGVSFVAWPLVCRNHPAHVQ